MRAAGLTFAVLALSPLVAQSSGAVTPKPGAAESPARADIRKLLHLLRAGENGMQAMRTLAESQQKVNPQIPTAFWDAFLAEFTAERLVDTALPAYEKNLTPAEVKALIAFFSTPEGQSYARKQSQILQEAMEAGQKLGAQVGQEVAARLQKEGKL
jgi:hypothetical protein